MSDYVYPSDLEPIREEVRRENLRAALAPRPDTPPAAPVAPSYTDRELAFQVLQLPERGLSELEAYRALERDEAGIISELATEIKRERLTRANADRRRIAAEQARSPEGRALAAAEALDAQALDAQRVEAGKALLASDPEGHGISREMIDQLAPAEVLSLSGLDQSPDPASDPVANAAKAAEGGSDQ